MPIDATPTDEQMKGLVDELSLKACLICGEAHEPRRLSFDGHGINACDVYRTRILDFTKTEQRPNGSNTKTLGPLFEAAPTLYDAMQLCYELLDNSKVRHFIGTNMGEMGRYHAAIRAVRQAKEQCGDYATLRDLQG